MISKWQTELLDHALTMTFDDNCSCTVDDGGMVDMAKNRFDVHDPSSGPVW